MPTAAVQKPATTAKAKLASFVPKAIRELGDPQRDIPRIAKDSALMAEIEAAIARVPCTADRTRGRKKMRPESI